MVDFYNFKDCKSDIQSIVHVINLLGKDLIGAEIGVFRGESFCTLLQNCPNIKTLFGVDSYKPYTDYLKEPYDGTPAYSITQKEIDYIKLTAHHNIQWSGFVEKAILFEKDSNLALSHFQDFSLDFIFLDTCMTYEQAKNDINVWYPKVKKRGLVAGHDWNSSAVQQAVNEFRKENNITEFMSTFDNTWCWIK
jgi:Methyltransferase domain